MGANCEEGLDSPLIPVRTFPGMDDDARIRELLLQIRDTEQRLNGLRAELRRLVEELGDRPLPASTTHFDRRQGLQEQQWEPDWIRQDGARPL